MRGALIALLAAWVLWEETTISNRPAREWAMLTGVDTLKNCTIGLPIVSQRRADSLQSLGVVRLDGYAVHLQTHGPDPLIATFRYLCLPEAADPRK